MVKVLQWYHKFKLEAMLPVAVSGAVQVKVCQAIWKTNQCSVQVLGDGKQRREETGNSSAKSTYPVPECPEHKQQLGNMKIVCPESVWSVEDTNNNYMLATDYHNWLSGKPDSNFNRRQFAKLHLGN